MILKNVGTPSAILYMNHSGLVLARLLSDFINVKRVGSIISSGMTEGYMKHIAAIYSDALKDSKNGFIIIADDQPDDIAKLKQILNERNPEIKIYTAALSNGNVDFSP